MMSRFRPVRPACEPEVPWGVARADMTSLQPLEAAACGGRMEITEAQQPLRLAHDGGWGTRAVGCEAQAQRALCRKNLKAAAAAPRMLRRRDTPARAVLAARFDGSIFQF